MPRTYHVRAVYFDHAGDVAESVELARGAPMPARGIPHEWGVYYRDEAGQLAHERECSSRDEADQLVADLAYPRHVLVIGTDGGEQRVPFEGVEPDLETLQTACRGHIEHIAVIYNGRRCDAFINEEGKLRGMADNLRATQMHNDWLRAQYEALSGRRPPRGFPVEFIVGPAAIIVVERP